MKKVIKFVKGKKEEEVSGTSKKFVNEKIDDNLRDDFIRLDKSVTKLHKAVWNENSDKVKSLIKTNDIDITDRFDRTALYFAVLKDNHNIVNILLDNNANQNIPDIDGITPFLKSIQLGYKQCASVLLKYGADIKKTDKDLNSCLHYAVMGKFIDIVSYLLSHNAECNLPNINGDCPLHIAVQQQNKHIIELLLDHDADLNIMNNTHLTPMMIAKEYKNLEIISLLENNHKTSNISFLDFTAGSSHKSSYENVNSLTINKQHGSDGSAEDNWNHSPVAEKSLTKITKQHVYNDVINITEEKSESDSQSMKCSENTSPQSGIIPPPCKPLRSLEYLQSIDNRPIHLLTIGKATRTRHISMTESDHSKNNTPHRYSYQGDFHLSSTEEKADAVNISGKNKMLSKLEAGDSTIQSDWSSNESLPLDELSSGGKKLEKSSKTNSFSENDKSTAIFLQKQFSLLEDYEKNREKRYSVSYEMDFKTVKGISDVPNTNLDIDHLLEDNNRINVQLEKYAGQSDFLTSTTKSKSLPRNCESYNSCYNKGSFSLPRTLDKDPFKEMKSYGYFKPKSHFSFSLKMLKVEKKSGFIDKLKNMFSRKSQIYLSEQAENGTWLYKKTDNEYVSPNKFNTIKSKMTTENSNNSAQFMKLKNFDLDSRKIGTNYVAPQLFTDNQNGRINKFLSLNNMNRNVDQPKNSPSSRSDVQTDEECATNFVKKTNSDNRNEEIACDECVEYVHQKLKEAEQNLTNKNNFIVLLQEQLQQLRDRNLRSINEVQEITNKFGITQQELNSLKQICTKYDEELQKLRNEKGCALEPVEDILKIKQESEKWKKQYEDLAAKLKHKFKCDSSCDKENTITTSIGNQTDDAEDNWRQIIHNEVTSAVNILKENSQSLISSLEKQNKKLETLVDKLQQDLDSSLTHENQLKKELEQVKNQLIEISLQNEKIKCEYNNSYEATLKTLENNNEKLKSELEYMTTLYKDLKQKYDKNVLYLEKEHQCTPISSEYDFNGKEEFENFTKKLSDMSDTISEIKKIALSKNEELQNEITEILPTKSKEFLEHMSRQSLQNLQEQIQTIDSSINDVEKLNNVNSDMQIKINELKLDKPGLLYTVEDVKNLIHHVKKSEEEIEIISSELRRKESIIRTQSQEISILNDIIKQEKENSNSLEIENKKDKISYSELMGENSKLKTELFNSNMKQSSVECENLQLQSSFDSLQKKNDNLNKKVNETLASLDEMKVIVDCCTEKIETLHTINIQYEKIIDTLKAQIPDEKITFIDYEITNSSFNKEQELLIKQLDKEKENVVALRKHIESLQFYHDNEMKASSTRIEELQNECETRKRIMQAEIDKLTNLNTVLQEKITAIKVENKHLNNHIAELKQEINTLHEKLCSLHDSKRYIDTLAAINQENIEMKTAMFNLREILEEKFLEKSTDNFNNFVEMGPVQLSSQTTDLSDEEQMISINLDSGIVEKCCKQPLTLTDALEERVSNIERKIEELDECVSSSTNEDVNVKSTSCPNLQYLQLDDDINANSTEIQLTHLINKSPSLDYLHYQNEHVTDACKKKWKRHLHSIQELRNELIDILHKLDEKEKLFEQDIDDILKICDDEYQKVINNLQKQVNDFKIRKFDDDIHKNYCCTTNALALVQQSEMEDDIYKLKKEHYKQQIESTKTNEVVKIKRHAEILAEHQQLKIQYLESKQKLLAELNAVQTVFQAKNLTKINLKQKFDAIIQDVNINKKIRKNKLETYSPIRYF